VKQRTETRARLSRLLTIAWLRELFSRQQSVALTVWRKPDQELAEAMREVDALAPASAGQWEVERIKAAGVNPLAFVLLAGTVLGAAGAGITISAPPRCTWADGTSVYGQCMFADEFNAGALDTAAWLAENTFPGPLLETPGEARCFRQENATVAAGELRMLSTSNARGSCPHAGYTPTGYNIANYPTMQPGATTIDIAAISTKTFRMKYGTVEMRAMMPSSGGDVSLWGTNCRFSTGVVDGLQDLFQMASGRTCDYPNPGAREMDIIQNSGTTLNTSWYRNSGDGATLVQNWTGVIPPGIDLYGDLWSTHGAIGSSKTFLGDFAPSDPTTNFHVYRWEWYPGWIALYIDGTRVSYDLTAAVTTELMFPMIWTIDNVASSFRMDYIRIWCEAGRSCEWVN